MPIFAHLARLDEIRALGGDCAAVYIEASQEPALLGIEVMRLMDERLGKVEQARRIAEEFWY